MTVMLEKVAKRYGRRNPWVLSDLDLELAGGTLTLLTGANGSGKTTLIRIIAGLTLPSAGVVRDRPGRIAVVPDRFVPPARMTARAYLGHLGRIRGLTMAQAAQQADELGERLSVLPGLDVGMQDLSKGNAQKVALAQAFMAPADLLVLDEARTALDVRGASVLAELLGAARKSGAAVVVTDPTLGVAYPDARRFRLARGALHFLDSASTAFCEQVTMRLRPRSLDEVLVPSGSFDGMSLSSSLDDGELTLVVHSDRCDDVLRLALSDGWSVLDVRRHKQEHRDERPRGPG